VAFKLAQAVRRQQKLEGSFEKWLLDVVAIGTVADSVPLVGENRTLVRYGLIVLNKTRRLGLHKLIEKARIQIGSIDAKAISFQIAPRLNAAGRIEHANTAYQLLITNNEKASQELADQLEATNQQRQKITEKLTTIAQAQIGELADRLVLFVSEQGEDWQAGIIGLIAGKISASHFRPTFVICKRENEFIGSGRSIEYLDIMEVLENSNKYLHKFGGHPQACGFTIDSQANLDNFQITATKFISNQLKDKDLRPQMDIEAEVMLDQVDWDLLEMMNCFSPFGEGNRRPIFVVKNVELTNFELVGLEKQHLRIFVKDKKGTVKKTIAFGFGQIAEKLEVGKNIDLVFSMGVNEWNGNRELQLKVIDLNLHD
ncbi:DHH family phosphoesterase, partial [Patescibacteria group bacterium]|nr:DHH family phosphoesterase [Patescibacteria group bacterium]